MKTVDYPVWLAVLPDQRTDARADAGAHPDGRSAIEWSKEAQLWFARPGADLSRLQSWLPDRSIRSSGGGDPQSEFLDALTSAGLVLDDLPVMDGKSHRVPVVEGRKGNRDGVYKGFLNGIKPGGWFINYHRADNDKDITKWKGSGSLGKVDPLARVHIRAVMRQSQDDTARKQAAIYARQTAKAHTLISRMPAADPQHAYLSRKGISVTDDIRQTSNGALAIPLYNVDGEFRTLQYIPPEGQKVLFTDAPKSGHFRVEGGPLVNGEPVLYAEGYATARSLHMVTGRPVVMTVDAGNMQAVGEILKARFPDSPHLFMADIDHKTEKNKGLLSAQRAADVTGGAVVAPDLRPHEIESGLTDFNDLHQSRGTDALRIDLLPRINEALIGLNYKDPAMATPDDTQPVPDNAVAPESATEPQSAVAPAAGTMPINDQSTPDTAATTTGSKSARRPGAAKEKSEDILALSAQGMKPAQIAKQLDIGQTSVYRILRAQQAVEGAAATAAVPASTVSPALETETAAVASDFSSVTGPESDPPVTSPAPALADDASPTLNADPALAASRSPSDAAPEPVAATAPEFADNVARAASLSASGMSLARVAAEMNLGVGETHRLIEAGKQQEAPVITASVGSDRPAGTAAENSPADFSKDFRDIAGRLRALKGEADTLDTDTLALRLGGLVNERIGLTEMWAQGNNPENSRSPSEESEAIEADLRAELNKRAGTASSPIAAAFGEENAILVGAARMAPSDDDTSAATKAARIDADKLLSRITHEKQADGKSVLYSLDGEPAFIDRGNRLVMAEGTSSHEEKVLAALLTAANHYHGRIELTGSDEFKAFAISVIVDNGLQVSMKSPSQQLALEEAKRAAGQPIAKPDAVRGDPVAPASESYPAAADTVPPVAPAAAAPVMADIPSRGDVMPAPSPQVASVPAMADAPVAGVTTMPTPSAAAKSARPEIRPDVHTPAEKAREPVTGKVTACGQAPFRFETNAQESTFITLRTREGSQTFWGKELAGLIRETRLREGQMVTLQWMGEQPVTVNKPVKDTQGNFTGHYEQIQTRRNKWSLTSARSNRVQTGGDEMMQLSAFSANRYTQVQHAVVSQLGISIDAPPNPADGLYWIRPDGQGSASAGDALSAARPAHNENAGKPVMTSWGEDGKPDLYLVQGDGHYLQGIVRQNDVYQHVLVSLPDSKEAPRMVINLLTPDGAKTIGSGNGINRSDGKPVPREHVVFRVTGDENQRIAKLHEPGSIPPALHARLGYDERYKAETAYPKEQPAAAPQAAPGTPPRPAQ